MYYKYVLQFKFPLLSAILIGMTNWTFFKVWQMNEKSYSDCNGAASKSLDCCLVTVRIYLVYFKIRCNLKSVIVKYRSLGDCKAFHSCYDKVHIFWEGHKTLRNLHRGFDRYYKGQSYGGDFAKFCGLLRIYEL